MRQAMSATRSMLRNCVEMTREPRRNQTASEPCVWCCPDDVGITIAIQVAAADDTPVEIRHLVDAEVLRQGRPRSPARNQAAQRSIPDVLPDEVGASVAVEIPHGPSGRLHDRHRHAGDRDEVASARVGYRAVRERERDRSRPVPPMGPQRQRTCQYRRRYPRGSRGPSPRESSSFPRIVRRRPAPAPCRCMAAEPQETGARRSR